MALTAQERLARLNAAFDKKAGGGNPNANWKLFYPFWKMAVDKTAVVRFLPDLDEDNPMMFLVENLTHELVINGEKKTVPCLEMHGDDCPICALSRKYYAEGKEAEKFGDMAEKARLEGLGKKYYRKKEYIGQILVIESPIDYEQAQLVKLISFGPKIFQRIQASFKSGDLLLPPFEFKGGYNFRINKTKSGQWADYSTSSFAPRETDVDDAVIAQLELYDLKNYRTAKIDHSVMEAMLLADQTGQSMPSATPAPVQQPVIQQAAAPVQTAAPVTQAAEPVAQAAAPVTDAAAPAGDAPKVDILAQLRERAAQRKAAGEAA